MIEYNYHQTTYITFSKFQQLKMKPTLNANTLQCITSEIPHFNLRLCCAHNGNDEGKNNGTVKGAGGMASLVSIVIVLVHSFGLVLLVLPSVYRYR